MASRGGKPPALRVVKKYVRELKNDEDETYAWRCDVDSSKCDRVSNSKQFSASWW